MAIGITKMVSVICAITNVAIADILYVDVTEVGANDGTSWQNAYAQLWNATEASQDGDQLWIAEGIYKPMGDRTATFKLRDNVQWYGGFPAGGGDGTFEARDSQVYLTTLSGDLLEDDLPGFLNYEDNSAHVVTANSASSLAVMDGLTISHGNDNISDTKGGGGLRAIDGTPTILNVILELNRANSYGYIAAACVDGGVWNKVIIRDNGLGSTVNSENEITIAACLFERNDFENFTVGGDGLSIVTNTVFTSNDPKRPDVIGISSGSANLLVIDCIISGFTGSEGSGLIVASGKTTVVNSRFTGNAGIAVYVLEGDVVFVNNMVVSSESFGLYLLGAGDVEATNCIFWDNNQRGVPIIKSQFSTGTVTVNYTTVDDYYPEYLDGVGNNGDDPLFGDLLGSDGLPGTGDEDYHLSPDSPSIDTGDNASVLADTADLDGDGDVEEPTPLDLDGNPRSYDPIRPDNIDPIVDRGPYEALKRTDPCYSDVNFDDVVDPFDAGFILARLGCIYPDDGDNCKLSDVNADGLVDPLDVGYVLARFGACP